MKHSKNTINIVTVFLFIASIFTAPTYGAELKSYFNKELGFSISYPESWSIKKPATGEGVIIEQKGDEYIQILTLVTKNVRDNGNPYEEIKTVMENTLVEKNIEPIKSWSNQSGIAKQYCTTYDEDLPLLGTSKITECSSLANEIYYKTKAVAKPEIHEKYEDTINEIVNSFEIQQLGSSDIEQNRVEAASKEANKAFVMSVLKWGVILVIGRFVIKRIKKQN
ncbi:MAG: PsbP-related protein [Candidatus Pacebacteria bacterium]|nr:PsbP-related protein [Candidatus Paceibacterota bacterium]